MKRSTLELLCCPSCQSTLSLRDDGSDKTVDEGSLFCPRCERSFPIRNGIVRFIDPKELEGPDRRFARFYNWFSKLYPLFTKVALFPFGGDRRARKEVLDRLGIELVDFGPKAVAVQAFPALLDKADPAAVVQDIIDRLMDVPGDVNSEELLEPVLASMSCKAAIKAGVVTNYGKIIGNVEAIQKIELFKGAELNGDVKAPDLIIESGCIFNGNCAMGQQSTISKSISETIPATEEAQRK